MSGSLCPNDWGMKRFLVVVLSAQLALLGLVFMEEIGVGIWWLQAAVGFIDLALVPGFIILRILRIHELGPAESVLYAVGLSIASVMFVGLVVLVILGLAGNASPLTQFNLAIALAMFVAVMASFAFVRDRGYSTSRSFTFPLKWLPGVLALVLLPVLASLGTALMNQYGWEYLLVLLILAIAAIVILIGFNRLVPASLLPFAVYAMSIALLFHRSLISPYLVGADIQLEYYLSNLVLADGAWDPNTYWSLLPISNVQSMMSVVMLAPIYSSICDLDLIWVFKVLYPLVFALVPLALFIYVRRQTNDTIAFFSAFFFISVSFFYGEMLQLARQQIAELFLVLILLLVTDRHLKAFTQVLLIAVFGYSLVVSHYGLTFILLFLILTGIFWIRPRIYRLLNLPVLPRILTVLGSPTGKEEGERDLRESAGWKPVLIRFSILAMLVIFALAWYTYTTNSSNLQGLTNFARYQIEAIMTDLFNSSEVQSQIIIAGESVSPLHSILKYLHLMMQGFILLGVILVLWGRSKFNFDKEYLVLSVSSLLILILALVLPFFTYALGITRVYQIMLLFLSPFGIIGVMAVIKAILNIFSKGASKSGWVTGTLVTILVTSLLFNSSLVYYAAGEADSSISFNGTMEYERFYPPEIIGAVWLGEFADHRIILADAYGSNLIRSVRAEQASSLTSDPNRLLDNSYVFLGKDEILGHGVVIPIEVKGVILGNTHLPPDDYIRNRSVVYSNDQTRIAF